MHNDDINAEFDNLLELTHTDQVINVDVWLEFINHALKARYNTPLKMEFTHCLN